jgi:hypothetical protein
MLPSCAPGVPIPKFASYLRHPRLRTSESKDASNFIDPVWLWFRSPHDGLAAAMMRTPLTATLEKRCPTVDRGGGDASRENATAKEGPLKRAQAMYAATAKAGCLADRI